MDIVHPMNHLKNVKLLLTNKFKSHTQRLIKNISLHMTVEIKNDKC